MSNQNPTYSHNLRSVLSSQDYDYRQEIIKHFHELSAFKKFITSIEKNDKTHFSISGLTPTAMVLFIGSYFEFFFSKSVYGYKSFFYVVSSDVEALEIYNQIKFFFPKIKNLFLYPSLSELPGKLTPLPIEECHTRYTLIHKLKNQKLDSSFPPYCIITSLNAVLEKIPSPFLTDEKNLTLRVGENRPLSQWWEILEKKGYRRNHEVTLCGEYAVKNGILDIYSPRERHPCRIYFWDDEVEMIKYFNTHTQQPLSVSESEEIKSFLIPSARLSDYHAYDDGKFIERIFSKKESQEKEKFKRLWNNNQEFSWSLLEPFLDSKKWVWISLLSIAPHPQILIEKKNLSSTSPVFEEISSPYYHYKEYDKSSLFASPEKRFFSPETLREYPHIAIHRREPVMSTVDNHIHFKTQLPMGFKKDLDKCREYLQDQSQHQGKKIFLFTSNPISGKKLQDFFKEMQPLLIIEENSDTIDSISSKKLEGKISKKKVLQTSLYIICQPLLGGMDYEGQLLITDFELFRKKPKSIVQQGQTTTEVLEYFTDLKENDYVVHINHGIGRYLGLERIKTGDSKKDYLKITYQGGDKLFIPVEQMNLVQRYVGSRGNSPRLDTIGGKSWNKIKQRVGKQIEVLTKELISLYQQRRDFKKVPCIRDDYFQELFEAGFPYQETEDQIRASEEIKRDLEKDIVMDRLLCGDVGFGKTEVAMRAIFKAVFSGRQVVVLVPTTILSMQHYYRFKERFQDFPVTIRVLNRFKDVLAHKQILKESINGEVEILIGTHALLSKKVEFKKIGLLVVDEEQKFGVKQKEKIKKSYPQVDTLSLSATPIPRTLHLSLSSIRSLSVLNTPPQNRHAVKTFVLEWDINVIKEAIRKERERGGQIFFVHNKVSTLSSVAKMLSQEMPEIQIRIAHGQMPGRDLETVMSDFVNNRFELLVSTSIIESGMDISRVNTLIVNNADHFGLTQLYQLRGRVGRSNIEAFAYFFLPANRSLSEDAMKRLDALTTYTQLGSGFKIAMSDLEIRGPGNILGAKQSGNIMAIGFELYTRLLNESIQDFQSNNLVENEKRKISRDLFPGTLLDLKYEGFIPHYYIPEDRQKISVYKKIAAIETLEKIPIVCKEIENQYGKIIPIIDRLLKISEIRVLGNQMRIFSIKEQNEYYEISLFSESCVNRDLLLKLVMDNDLQTRPESPDKFRFSTIDEKRNRSFSFEARIGKLKALLISLQLS